MTGRRDVERQIVGAALQPVASDPPGDAVERPHGRRQRDALELAGEEHEPVHGGDEVGPPLARRDGVDLVEDHRPQAGEERRAGFRVEQQVEALRRGDQDLRTLAHDPLAFGGGRVATAHRHPDARQLAARGAKGLGDPGQRLGEIALDVGVQCLERRNVEHPRRPLLPDSGRELLQRPEEGGQGLAAAGRSGQQDVPAVGDRTPGQPLDLGRRAEALLEPAADPGVEALETHVPKLSLMADSGRPAVAGNRSDSSGGLAERLGLAAGISPGRK